MKPILTIIQYNCDNHFPKRDGVEYITLDYDGDKEVFILNTLLRMSNGTYVITLRNGDTPSEDFLETILSVLGSNRDVITYSTVSSIGDRYDYTILQMNRMFQKQFVLTNPKYFHCVKRMLLQSVNFLPTSNPFDQYSNRIRRVCFTEYKIDSVLLATDNN